MRELATNYVCSDLTDFYQFGVFDGNSMVAVSNIYKSRGIKLRSVYGFDSFTGMPEQDFEPHWQDAWKPGELNVSQRLNLTENQAVEFVRNKIDTKSGNYDNLHLFKGFFCDTLHDDMVKEFDMRPAGWVDCDADIYSSTLESMDFMCRNGLIVPGTILYYDDWGGVPDHLWQNNAAGESRAHVEICKEYGMECSFITQIGSTYPHVQRIYRVDGINKTTR
jgi:hypothetical protein